MKTLKLNKIVGLIFLMICTFNSYSHSGRTDSKGGHHDYKNGGYHFHHGNRPHQHPNGQCILTSTARKAQAQPWYKGLLVLFAMVGGTGGFFWAYNRIENADKDWAKKSLLEKTLFSIMYSIGTILILGFYGVIIGVCIKFIINLFN